MSHPRRRRLITRPLALLALGAATLVSCGDEVGDKEAFCQLLRQGVGIGSDDAEVSPADFDALSEVAPEDIARAVKALANAARNIDLIPNEDLGALFDAAFSDETAEARGELLAYGTEQCGIEGLRDGEVSSDLAVLTELREYVVGNFPDEPWTEVVDYDVSRQADDSLDIEVRFRTEPLPALALEACNAVSVFLYAVREETGAVHVRSKSGTLVAQRQGPDAPCTAS
jgi:hypothetical protein